MCFGTKKKRFGSLALKEEGTFLCWEENICVEIARENEMTKCSSCTPHQNEIYDKIRSSSEIKEAPICS